MTICYAVKANGNVNLLRLLAEWGSGFDIVSGGELERVRCAGADMAKVVFSGVGKTAPEIKRAFQLGVRALHVESAPELDLIGDIAAGMGVVANVCMRVNPDLSVDTHDYISTARADNKFGVPAAEALELYARSARHRHLCPVGLSAHLGSQIFAPTAFQALLSFLLDLLQRLRAQGIELEYLDIGGGLGVDYQGDKEQLQPRRPAARAGAAARRELGRADIGARAFAGGCQRCTADASAIQQARWSQALRHCRRGDERLAAPSSVPGLARGASSELRCA